MQPFKLVPSLSARMPGRITSPRGLDEAAASQGSTSRNRPSDGQDLWVTTAVFNSCYDAVTYLSKYQWLHCYTYGPVPLQWIQQRDDIQIYPSYILKEQEGCCHERDASKGQTVLELVSSLLPNSIVVVHMSHPWHFHRLPVQVCRRNGLPRNVALGLAPATGPQKSPNRTKTPKFQSPKSARRDKESKTAQLRIPRHGMVTPGASVARWRSSLSKPETWHRCSQHWMPDRNRVVMQCQPTVANFTNRNITTIATYPTCMAAHSISGFF
jgi:hypothetical protein